jgi:hypothetical protein
MGSSFFIPSLTKTFTKRHRHNPSGQNLHGILLNPLHVVTIHLKHHLFIPVPHQTDQPEHINLKTAVHIHEEHEVSRRFNRLQETNDPKKKQLPQRTERSQSKNRKIQQTT